MGDVARVTLMTFHRERREELKTKKVSVFISLDYRRRFYTYVETSRTDKTTAQKRRSERRDIYCSVTPVSSLLLLCVLVCASRVSPGRAFKRNGIRLNRYRVRVPGRNSFLLRPRPWAYCSFVSYTRDLIRTKTVWGDRGNDDNNHNTARRRSHDVK